MSWSKRHPRHRGLGSVQEGSSTSRGKIGVRVRNKGCTAPHGTATRKTTGKICAGRRSDAARKFLHAWETHESVLGGAVDFERVRAPGMPGSPPIQVLLEASETLRVAEGCCTLIISGSSSTWCAGIAGLPKWRG
jgi:hypothetical protein